MKYELMVISEHRYDYLDRIFYEKMRRYLHKGGVLVDNFRRHKPVSDNIPKKKSRKRKNYKYRHYTY